MLLRERKWEKTADRWGRKPKGRKLSEKTMKMGEKNKNFKTDLNKHSKKIVKGFR